jgi:hypothetical protein
MGIRLSRGLQKAANEKPPSGKGGWEKTDPLWPAWG